MKSITIKGTKRKELGKSSSKKLRKTQSGVLQNYLLAGFGCLVIIIILIQQIR